MDMYTCSLHLGPECVASSILFGAASCKLYMFLHLCIGDHDGRGQHFAHLQYPDRTDTECFKRDEAITLNCSHSDLRGPGIIFNSFQFND